MTVQDKREAVAAKYREIIGRNIYSQDRRNYCYKKYSDGKYYSDCSSSVSFAYKEAGFGFGILNTVGMYQSKKLVQVPVEIRNGQVQDASQLRIGDMLLFAGGDSSRSYAGYVGHVEMVGEISGSKVTLYGHGSGNPSKKDMTTYCRKRYNTSASTKLGNRGLIRVLRFLTEDSVEEPVTTTEEVTTGPRIAAGTWNLRVGPGKEYEVSGIVGGGSPVEIVARLVDIEDWYFVKCGDQIGFIATKAVEEV